MATTAQTVAKVLEDTDEPGGIVRVACSASILATHLRPDLDALLGLWMCQRLRHNAGMSAAKIIFVPANVRGVADGTLAVDIGMGRGIRPFGRGHCLKWSAHPDGGSASMAVWRALPEDERSYFAALAQAISDADQGGENIHRTVLKKGAVLKHGRGVATLWNNPIIRNQVLDTNMWSMHQAMMNVHDDRSMARTWFAVFDGILSSGMQWQHAHAVAEEATVLLDGTVAILPHNSPLPTSKVVFDRGIKLAVFSSEIGTGAWTLGVTRSASREAISFINLAKYQDEITGLVPGIYIHPSGFLAGWTATAPLLASCDEFEKRRKALIQAVIKVVETEKLERSSK